jgi:peptide/nickel transport system ATP-binding protein
VRSVNRPIAASDVLDVNRVSHVYASANLAAVDEVSLQIGPGESLGLVGESGCGKSTLARLVCGLIAPSRGEVRVAGLTPERRSGAQRLALARAVQMVFQDPYGSLNPRQRIGQQIAEPLRIHKSNRAGASESVIGLMERVGLAPDLVERFPHQLSGGQRQRVAIARALAVGPALLVCDEPVSALDVSVQAQILNVLRDLQRDLGLALLFISHDLRVVRCIADRIAVMHRGRIVEQGEADSVWSAPRHPYSKELLQALPPEA